MLTNQPSNSARPVISTASTTADSQHMRDMAVLESPAAMRAWAHDQHVRGAQIALVPTMGALHAGHLALIDAASRRAEAVVVSIFVNPLQFNRPDDFVQYPRPLVDDLDQCAHRGVAAVYAPTQASMYPAGFETMVEPGSVAEPLEGAGRPGHFRGVTTVVAKLFNAVSPDAAIFGRKDFQQLAVIRRMVTDLDMGIEIIGIDTIRESDGLALSSRNRRLDADRRRAAVVVPKALAAAVAVIADARRAGMAPAMLLDAIRSTGATVVATEPLATLEYFDVVDPDTLRAPLTLDRSLLLITAVWFGDVRLIDNCLIDDCLIRSS